MEPRREPVRLSIGIPDPESLPRAELAAALDRVLAEPGDGPLRYHFGAGWEPLRELLAERYARETGIDVDLEWLRLANGSAGAIDLVCRTFVEPGDVIVAESPSYMGTLHNFRGVRADVRPVPVDDRGLVPEALERVLAEVEREGRRAKLIYTISSFQNPTGATLSESRRHALLGLASRHGALVLDDEAYAELRFGTDRPPSLLQLSGGHGVITVGTFSKLLATGLRVGWVCARPAWLDLLRRMRFDMGQSVLVHRMLAEYLADGRLDAHLARVRKLYAEKAALLGEALREHAGQHLSFREPRGGFYLWAGLEGLPGRAVWRAAAEEGVFFPLGTAFFPHRRDPTGDHVRLAFSWTARDALREGARRLGLACERVAEEIRSGGTAPCG